MKEENESLDCPIQFNTTKSSYAKLERIHHVMLGEAASQVAHAITARVVFLRGLEKVLADQKRPARAAKSASKKRGKEKELDLK